MIKTKINLDHALVILNRMGAADPGAAEALIDTRVPCNDALAEDPAIQVTSSAPGSCIRHKYNVGFLGILNGLFGADDSDGCGAIQAVYRVKCPEDHELALEALWKGGEPCPKDDCGGTLVSTFAGFELTDQGRKAAGLPTL